MKKLNILLFVCISLLACNNKVENQTVVIDNKYSMELPDFLSKTTILNDEASLQYMNGLKELYIAVLDEPMSDFELALKENDLTDEYKNDLKGYSSLVIDTFKENLEIVSMSDPNQTTINGLPALIYTVKAKVENYVAYYNYVFIQGKKDYYQIITWTLDSKEDDHKEQMQTMISSFKEV